MGAQGWPEHAPFNAILVAAATNRVPPPLVEQLAPGGRLVLPIGSDCQQLMLFERRSDGSLDHKSIAPVQFVPMTGEGDSSLRTE